MLRQFAFEEITVSTAVKNLTVATYKASGGWGSAQKAQVQVLNAPIRVKLNGDSPTTTAGFVESNGSSFMLENEAEILGFRAIRDGGSDAKIQVSYLRKM